MTLRGKGIDQIVDIVSRVCPATAVLHGPEAFVILCYFRVYMYQRIIVWGRDTSRFTCVYYT